MSILTRKYPFTSDSHWIRDCILYSVIVFLIMYLLQPFGFNTYQGNKLLVSLLFGAVTFGGCVVFGLAARPFHQRISPWRVWHEALSLLIQILFIAICNFFVFSFVYHYPITLDIFLMFLYWTLIISMFVTDVLASKVNSLDIKVKLYSNGNAAIEERWDIDVDDDDAQTEWFVAHRGLGDMRIEQLSMKGYIPGKEGLQPYQTLGSWDVDASRKEKAGKCGLHNNGQEICWGFGDYGRHEYVVNYTLTNLVKSYDTNDGFNHCFVDMDCTIKQANVTITAVDSIQLSESNTRHWAFGYEGRFEFIGDSCLVADSQGKLSSSKRMILLLEFDKGLFQPAAKASEPWADKKKRALEGSDYETDDLSFWEWVLAIGIILVCALLYFFAWPILTFFGYLLLGILGVLFWIVSLSPLRTKLRRRKLGIVDGRYFRDVKKDWTLPMNKMLVDDLSYFSGMNEQHVIGALLLKLMSSGDLTITRENYKGELKDMLKILNPIEKIDEKAKGDDKLCQHVLRLLSMASGKDLVLQPTEFKSWCQKKDNVSKVKDFMALLEKKPDKNYIEKHV